jgi:hypothetical protein
MKDLIVDILFNNYFMLIFGALALIAEIEFFVWRERRHKNRAATVWRLFYIPEGFVWLTVSFIILGRVDTMPIVIHTDFPKPILHYELRIEPPQFETMLNSQ